MQDGFQNNYALAPDLTELARLGLDHLLAAKINPLSGLVTDFLNPFNEYLMLADMVAAGLEEATILREWVPPDYRSHFKMAGFAESATILEAFQLLPEERRLAFETEVECLVCAIEEHQLNPQSALLSSAHIHRERLAQIISPANGELPHHTWESRAAQDDIDALFG